MNRTRIPAGLRPLAGATLLLWLAACGGGGGTDVNASRGTVDAAAPPAAEAPATPVAPPAPAASDAAAPVPAPAPAPVSVTAQAPLLGDCELFPADAVFNTRIDDASRFPAHADSARWINLVGGSTRFRADWWRSEDPTQRDAYYGIPVNLVDGTSASTDWAPLSYDFRSSGVSSDVGWPHESDCAVAEGDGFGIARNCSNVPSGSRRFPIPKFDLKNEGGTCNDPNTCGDHHLLVVEQGACRLWEGFATYKLNGSWYSLATAAWNLKSLDLRPDTWTAADAAGLPITPFLVKAAEASAGEIRHALRVTFRDAVLARQHTWPARHFAGGDTPGGIPFGAVLRLKSDFVIPDHWTTQAKAIATAAKRYGLYVSDIGMDFYVQGEPSVQWDERTFGQVSAIPLSQMEFVDLGAITRDPRFSRDSMAAQWR
ncbi:hypothetical protein JI739_10760 [Ramlibacter sp. AW1]|uniref:Uncharacterized protein n=1 Tax=Ramlibacter aurantiacus TaxID=2801330 RepID=A0A936ZTE6_9BURK|nr:hypothetical protein [Ramlibacter aurantiacus]MBL0420825.1 hypothetical protein [Ramlibacter aurantiacus]